MTLPISIFVIVLLSFAAGVIAEKARRLSEERDE